MSEVKVNKISPRANCGTVQLGDSGDTITIPAGATITNNGTQTGFGREGSVNWQTGSIKTAATFTAVSGEGYFVDTSSNAVTANLPAGSAGAIVAFSDYARNFATNPLTISPNGSEKIGGTAADLPLNVNGQALTLVYVDGTKGWMNVQNAEDTEVASNFIVATGGTETESGDFKIHTFTGPGTFIVSGLSPVAASNQVDYLVVAGGGAGGGGFADDSAGGGGGGAGGFRVSNDTCMPAPLTSPLANPTGITATVASFPITVGAGGSINGIPVGGGGNGSNSVFSSITSTGGGGGGGNPNTPAPGQGGQPGGSGGGAGRSPGSVSGGTGNTPPVSPAQGTGGGNGNQGAPNYGQGGGGGASVAGNNPQNATPTAGGDGGAGSYVLATGFAGSNGTTGPVSDTRYFAGGGGGSSYQGGSKSDGGTGGGGAGNYSPNLPSSPGISGVSGGTNTGGGGGGMSQQGNGGAGGSGIVILRYKFQ